MRYSIGGIEVLSSDLEGRENRFRKLRGEGGACMPSSGVEGLRTEEG